MTRKSIERTTIVLAVLLLGTYKTYAQGYATVVQAKVSVSKALEGQVTVGIERAPVAGANVVLFKPDWQTVLAHTESDAKGHFHLVNPPWQELYYLQISAPGIDPYRLRVRIKKGTSRQLDIHMINAT
jgi:Carboxypeptidase regulatory-like domain